MIEAVITVELLRRVLILPDPDCLEERIDSSQKVVSFWPSVSPSFDDRLATVDLPTGERLDPVFQFPIPVLPLSDRSSEATRRARPVSVIPGIRQRAVLA